MPDRLVSLALLAPFALCLSLASCPSRSASADLSDVVVVALPQLERPVEQRKNMIWIPAGSFIAGTPLDVLPRIADAELAGVPVTLNGFFIDQHPFPNEPGAIQMTNLTQERARELCVENGKRLCTELEWERACKGPDSHVYDYGKVWRPDVCGSGSHVLMPSGSRVSCRSGFDVHDMHGGAAEWTESSWGRGDTRQLVVLRGGSGNPSEVSGRCAHATASRPGAKGPNIGFRCCAGDANDAAVQLDVSWSEQPFVAAKPERDLASALASIVPADRLKPEAGEFRIDRIWHWFPIGNEDLLVGAGCARTGARASCGIVVARPASQGPRFLAFASSSGWVPLIKIDDDRRVLWLFGVDDRGQFRRRIEYFWGSVGVGDEDRAGEPHKRKKKD
jgi:formylglycine-generating enzyme